MSNEVNKSTPTRKRGLRGDIGRIKYLERDAFALTWIGHQYAIRLDQLQWLLGERPGKIAEHQGWITETAARNVVARWMKAGWVEAKQIRAREPLWIWPTRKGLRKANLPYSYRDIEQTGLDDLKHLYAINEIRLSECDEKTRWISERQLLQGLQHTRGKDLLHRPDAIANFSDGRVVAIEAELSTKVTRDLLENLMELMRGEEYLRLKNEYGPRRAKEMSSQNDKNQFSEIWYFGPPKVRKQVQKARSRLLHAEALTEGEIDHIYTCWYPLTQTDEEEELETQENRKALYLKDSAPETEDSDDEEFRLSSAEDREREV